LPNVNAVVSINRGVMIVSSLINQLTVVTFLFSSLLRLHVAAYIVIMTNRKNVFVTRGVCTNYGKRIVRTEDTHRVKVVRNFFASLNDIIKKK